MLSIVLSHRYKMPISVVWSTPGAALLRTGDKEREISGGVWFDRFTRGRYATDASHYQMMPLGVVAPRSIAERA